MDAIRAVQDSALGVWMREDTWALFAALIVHTAGMGLAIGVSGAIALRVFGLPHAIPFRRMAYVFPAVPWALTLVLISGVLLVVAYPAKALTNPLFYFKLAMAGAALLLTWSLTQMREPFGRRERLMAAGSLALWPAALTAGKFLAYTHKMLMVY